MISVLIAMGRSGGLHPRNPAQVLLARIQPLHAVQNCAGSRLRRQMHMIAQRRIRVDRVDDLAHEIARMGSGEAHPADTFRPAHLVQEPGEIPSRRRWIAIAVDVLAQQLDFAIARARELGRFRDYRRAGAATLRPSRERHHAIGAGFVAALNDGDIGAMRIVAAGERRFKRQVGIQAQAGDATVAGFQLHQQSRQLVVAGRAANQTDVRRFLENLLAFLLRDTSQHREGFAFAVLLELIEPVETPSARLCRGCCRCCKTPAPLPPASRPGSSLRSSSVPTTFSESCAFIWHPKVSI